MILLFKKNAKKACIGKPIARQREREKERKRDRKKKSRSRCQRKIDGAIFGVILFRLSENSILMDKISENIFNEELDKLLSVKILFREIYTRLSTTWRSKIWNEEIQNTHYSSHSASLNLKDDNLLKANQCTDQAQRERTHLCSRLGRRTIFIKKAVQEVVEKLKN